MKKFVVMAALGVLLCAAPVSAGPFHWDCSPDTATVLGAITTIYTMESDNFMTNIASGYFVVYVSDTGAGNGAATDSLIFAMQKFVDIGTAAGQLWPDSANGGWATVAALPAFDPTKRAGAQRYMCADTVELGVLQLGGLCRFILYKGGGQALDTVNADYDFEVFFEQGPTRR